MAKLIDIMAYKLEFELCGKVDVTDVSMGQAYALIKACSSDDDDAIILHINGKHWLVPESREHQSRRALMGSPSDKLQ